MLSITVALCGVAPLLQKFKALRRPFVEALLSLPAQDRAVLLTDVDGSGAHAPSTLNSSFSASLQQGGFPLLPASVVGSHPHHGVPRAESLPSQWHALSVAQTLAALVAETKPDNLTPAQLELLDGCVHTLELSVQTVETDRDAWTNVFSALMAYVYVAVCDDEVVDWAISTLRGYYKMLPESASQVPTNCFRPVWAVVVNVADSRGPWLIMAMVMNADPEHAAIDAALAIPLGARCLPSGRCLLPARSPGDGWHAGDRCGGYGAPVAA